MTRYQLRTRLLHFFQARHWRGHGVHSPMLYSLIREEVMRCGKRKLADRLVFRFGPDRVSVVDRVEDMMLQRNYCVLLREPFADLEQHRQWQQVYEQTHCTVLHCQGLLVIFFDPKLQKQYLMVRN